MKFNLKRIVDLTFSYHVRVVGFSLFLITSITDMILLIPGLSI
jgi:hypothetical protein